MLIEDKKEFEHFVLSKIGGTKLLNFLIDIGEDSGAKITFESGWALQCFGGSCSGMNCNTTKLINPSGEVEASHEWEDD